MPSTSPKSGVSGIKFALLEMNKKKKAGITKTIIITKLGGLTKILKEKWEGEHYSDDREEEQASRNDLLQSTKEKFRKRFHKV